VASNTHIFKFVTPFHVQKLNKFIFLTTGYPFLGDVLSTNQNIYYCLILSLNNIHEIILAVLKNQIFPLVSFVHIVRSFIVYKHVYLNIIEYCPKHVIFCIIYDTCKY